MLSIIVNAKIFRPYLADSGLKLRCGHAVIIGVLYKVAYVACPAAEVGSTLVIFIVGNVERREHMAEIHRLPVGNGEIVKCSQRRRTRTVGSILLRNIGDERAVRFTRHDRPVAVVVFLNAGTDVVYHQQCSVGIVLSRIAVGIPLKNLEASHKTLKIRDLGDCSGLFVPLLRICIRRFSRFGAGLADHRFHDDFFRRGHRVICGRFGFIRKRAYRQQCREKQRCGKQQRQISFACSLSH